MRPTRWEQDVVFYGGPFCGSTASWDTDWIRRFIDRQCPVLYVRSEGTSQWAYYKSVPGTDPLILRFDRHIGEHEKIGSFVTIKS